MSEHLSSVVREVADRLGGTSAGLGAKDRSPDGPGVGGPAWHPPSPRVSGVVGGRSFLVEFPRTGILTIRLQLRSAHALRIAPSTLLDRILSFHRPIRSGDPRFDDLYRVEIESGPGLEESLADPGFREIIESLDPFEEISAENRLLRLGFPYDSESLLAESVVTRVETLASLASRLEESVPSRE